MQLKQFINDVVSLCSASAPTDSSRWTTDYVGHDIGRVVVSEITDSGDYIVIDGQQRLTTACIFLCSVRDFLRRHTFDNAAVSQHARNLAETCDCMIMCESRHGVVIPSYLDRKAFADCVERRAEGLCVAPAEETVGSSDERASSDIQRAKNFFDSLLWRGTAFGPLLSRVCERVTMTSGRSRDEGRGEPSEEQLCGACGSLVAAVLDKLHVMLFVAREKELHSVYERLAMREALVAKSAYNRAPGVGMAEMDLVRNFVTSFFRRDEDKIDVYLELWAPLEEAVAVACDNKEERNRPGSQSVRAAGATSAAARTVLLLDSFPPEHTSHMEAFLAAFAATKLPVENNKLDKKEESALSELSSPSILDLWADPGADFFPMYKLLKDCVYAALRDRGVSEWKTSGAWAEGEEAVRRLLEDMLGFARDSFLSSWRLAARQSSGRSRGGSGGESDAQEEEEDRVESLMMIGRHCSEFRENTTEKGLSESCKNTVADGGVPCPCILRGTLCTNCIVKKYAKK